MATRLITRFRTRELTAALQAHPTAAGLPVKAANPFVPHKNAATGRWAPPKYSRRRQAALVKAARASNALHLLPPGPKLGRAALEAAVAATPKSLRLKPSNKEATWARTTSWVGKLREKTVKGADVGNRLYAGRKRMFKGHRWQRTMPTRELRRKMVLKSMKSRVRRFKSVYRRRRPNPLGRAKVTAKGGKLPF
ncbi:54S ribosomal protein L25, mitochondrial [Phanerochaete sordida]|uniref:54S ribosomal protein L25, mitochondrial n=1 Tax=Phanerochaete sordida TaxID=48140 RepID=A0A9P3LHA2_9APHY|nr:54S ribosomal protein L25, mitochondrial [Phanerochaete sordida]